MTSEEFEAATNVTLNYRIRIQPLEYLYLDGDVLRDKYSLSSKTYIDMSIKGLHIEEQLLATLREYYL